MPIQISYSDAPELVQGPYSDAPETVQGPYSSTQTEAIRSPGAQQTPVSQYLNKRRRLVHLLC